LIRFFWIFRYLNLVLILFFLVFCVFSFDDFKVYFDSERIIELVDVDKDIIEKSIDDSNLLLISVNLSDSFTYQRALAVSSALEIIKQNDNIHSVRSVFNERVLLTKSVIPISIKLLDLDHVSDFEKSLIKINNYSSNFITDDFQKLLFIVKCKNLGTELEKIKVLEFLDNQFFEIFGDEFRVSRFGAARP